MSRHVRISNKGPVVCIHIPDFSGLGSEPFIDTDGSVHWMLHLRGVFY